MKIYVGNLAAAVTNEDLRAFFAAHGQVITASVVKDRFSDRSKGFGFVDMSNEVEGRTAINALNGKELRGRPVMVNVAQLRGNGGPSSGRGRS